MKLYKNYITSCFPIILAIICVLVLQACSNKFMYKQLDWVTAAYIESYVTLDEDQSQILLEQLQISFRWQRKSQLRLYSKLALSVRADIEKGLDSTRLNGYLETSRKYYKTFFSRLTENLAVLLPKLSEDQIKEVINIFTDKNSEFRELYLDKNKEELKEQKLEDLIEKFEDWLDDLSDEQIMLLNNFTDNYVWDYEELYQIRLKWQKQMSVLLLQANKGKKVLAQIIDLNYDNFRNKDAMKRIKQKKMAYINLVISVSKIMSKKQKKYLLEKIDDYNTLFLDLAIN